MKVRRLVVTLTAATLLGTGYLSAATGPLLRLSERRIDFGRVEQYIQVHKQIMLRNEGDAPLQILKIDSDCGCTVGMPGDSIILPGKETTLSVDFSTRNYKGDQEKTITLHTNDPAEPKATIRVTADVHALVRLEPEVVPFGMIAKGETPTKRVRISADKGTQLKVNEISGSEEILSWSVTPAASDDEEAFWIDLKIRADAPAGVFRRTLVVAITGPPVPPRTELAIQGTILSYFVVGMDARIMLPPTNKGTRGEGNLPITCDGSKPYKLLGVTSSVPYLAGEIVPDGEKAYTLKIVVKEDAPPGRFQEMLTIETTDPEQPTIEIRVRGNVRE